MNELKAMADRVRARLVAAGIAGGQVISSRSPPTRDGDCPAAQVYFGADKGARIGDPRTGVVSLAHTSKLVVEVVDKADDDDDQPGEILKEKLYDHAQAICAALLPDPFAWGGDSFEGIDGVDQMYLAPPDGEVILGRVQVQIDVLWVSVWAPSTASLPDFQGATFDAGDGIGAEIDVPSTP